MCACAVAFCAGGRVEDRRAVLGSHVGTLAVQLRRVVDHAEEDLEQGRVRDLRGIEGDLDRLGVPGGPAAHRLVLGRAGRAARVSRYRSRDPLYSLEDPLDPPEASAREDGRLLGRRPLGGTRATDRRARRQAREHRQNGEPGTTRMKPQDHRGPPSTRPPRCGAGPRGLRSWRPSSLIHSAPPGPGTCHNRVKSQRSSLGAAGVPTASGSRLGTPRSRPTGPVRPSGAFRAKTRPSVHPPRLASSRSRRGDCLL